MFKTIYFSFSKQTIATAPQQISKFYKLAKVQQVEDVKHPDHLWLIRLDDRNVRTSFNNILAVPNPHLAHAIAHEYNMQKDIIRPSTMPLTLMAKASVDIDLNVRIRDYMIASVIRYLQADTVLFREDPDKKLYKIQQDNLNPVLEQFNNTYKTKLKINYGLEIKELLQSDQDKIFELINFQDNWNLVSLDQLIENLKSSILGIQTFFNVINVEEAVRLSRLEEQFQIDQFGKVEGHHDVDENNVLVNSVSAKLFQQLLQYQKIF